MVRKPDLGPGSTGGLKCCVASGQGTDKTQATARRPVLAAVSLSPANAHIVEETALHSPGVFTNLSSFQSVRGDGLTSHR